MIERLRALVGAEGVRPGAEGVRIPVTTGGRGEAAAAVPVVVAPDSAEAAAAVLRVATEEGWRVRFAGGTAVGSAAALVLTTERLAGIVAYEPADLVLSAGAGTTLGALRAQLAPAGQWLPLDPPGGAATTLGALVAGARAGPLREGYGTPRDQVLGLQLVTGDGRIVECGGRVMKNVAGYDLVKLLVGSRGTLGFLARVDLRLRALPACDRTLAFAAGSPGPLCALVGSQREARIEPVALELLSPATARAVAATGAANAGQWLLLIRLQGNAPAVESAAAQLKQLAAHMASSGTPTTTEEPGDSSRIWEELSRLEAGAALAVRLADRPSALAATLELAQGLPGVAAGEAPVVAHAGAGIVRVLVGAQGAGQPTRHPGLVSDEGWELALRAARATLSARRGTLRLAGAHGEHSVHVGHGAHRVPAAWLDIVSTSSPTVARLQREIRARFDPAGILVPPGEAS